MDYYYDDLNDNTETTSAKKRTVANEIFDWADAIVVSVVTIILLFTFVFRIVGIKGESMQDTLYENDRVIITDFLYTPKQGDIVVISRNYLNKTDDNDQDDSPIIKRVIATEGQKVTIDPITGTVTVDGKVLSEEYVKKGEITTWMDGSVETKSVTVEKGKVFVMGDNRGNSLDSRSSRIGQVDTRYILGHAVMRILPVSDITIL